MNDMVDGNSAALRIHEREQDEADRLMDLVSLRIDEMAYEAITDGPQLQSLLDDYEVSVGSELARAFRNLDRAAKERTASPERQYALDAVLQSLFALKRKCEDVAKKDLAR